MNTTTQAREALGVAPAASTAVAAAAKPATLASLMNDPKIKAQMALALPKHMTADRMARIALTEIRKVPALAECNQASFLGAIMQCAQLGLEPGSALGHAYLLPFGSGKAKDGRANVQLIIGYRGMIDLARRSGQIVSLTARTVCQNDEFRYQLGIHEDLVHVPADTDRGAVTHVYAVALLKDGGVQFEVMSRADVEAVRRTSKAATNGPWVSHWDEMAKKTVTRRLFKWLPVSIELAQAVTIDEAADRGAQRNADVIDGEFAVIDDGEAGRGYADFLAVINAADSKAAAELELESARSVLPPEEFDALADVLAARWS